MSDQYPPASADEPTCGARQVFQHRGGGEGAATRMVGDPCDRPAGHPHDVHAFHIRGGETPEILAFTWPWTPDPFSPGGTQQPQS